ncbi:MAG TPA: Ig-like domain-containing protein [Blastocatellia bacterium]|nr:Ig-like domain-containing protein [Blastocatellia bacterium]
MKLAHLPKQGVAAAGLEFAHSGPPGAVVMAAVSVSRSGNQVFRVPLVDPAAQQSSTGGYPWYIDETSSTVVYVKNVTDQPQQYVMELSYPGGAYTLGLRTVAAGQTAAVDIRQLRDSQVADEHGQVIPKEAASGQVHWSLRGAEELVLIGRAEQADLARGLSSSYACQNCCGDSFYQGSCLPNPVIGIPGSTNQFTAQEQDKDCYGNLRTPFVVSASWNSDNTAVATVTSYGLATARAPGSATIWARWEAYTRYFRTYPAGCVTQTIFPGASALCTVARVPRIRSISQNIIDESTQGDEVVECGRFEITIKYDVTCPPGTYTLSVLGNIQPDAEFICDKSLQLITNDNNEVCTYQVTKLYRMKNRLSQTTGTAFTSYRVELTDSGRMTKKNGEGFSVRASIPGTTACQGSVPCQ